MVENSKNISTVKSVYNECYKIQMEEHGDRGITKLLMEIVGVTSTNTSFSIGFGLMDKEKDPKYIWSFKLGRYKTDVEWNSFIRDWNTLVNSLIFATYLRNYSKVESRATYHPENFVSTWTNQILNFYNDTNNRVESQYSKLKNSCIHKMLTLLDRYLLQSTFGDLHSYTIV
uniref:Uncharacterized protein n=1 Tax=Lactuca sativa TaxID=4236 RepID=A0A9R1UNX0_LACSA|nr:hypothetical protein LSAT_V11C800438680 [Lactuca sativa]